MKRLLLRFMLVFWAVLTLSYAAAPFDSSDGGHEKTERSRTRNLTSPKIQSLHTEGLACYIGVSNSYFTDKFGEPDEKIDSIEGVEWWNYDVNQNDYLRVGIDKYTKKVCDIIELSAKIGQQLSVGMSMEQVLKKTTLYANFAFDVNEQTAQIELSEYDLNNHPLVSFDNGSYAILDFTPRKKKVVYAIHYLDKNELLRGKYYKALSKTPLPSRYVSKIDWEKHDGDFSKDLISQLNVKRLQEGNVPVEYDYNAESVALDLMNSLEANPRKYLSKKEFEEYRLIRSETFENTRIFYRVPKNIPKDLMKDADVSSDYRVYIAGPILTNTLFYTDNNLYENIWKTLSDSKTEKISVVFKKALVVIVVEN